MEVESHIETICGVKVIYVKFNQTEEYYTGANEFIALSKTVNKNFVYEGGAFFYNGVPIIYHPALD